ncbi:unnamed protein product [Ectocarpus sp. CCAP 1310/34]|nr:unnamed protein product [Ectocarpus sp. CCAP 1310/34]
MHSLWANQKHHNAKTERACQACVVPRRDLGNPKYDIKDREKLSRALGVVVPRYPNPLDEVAFDRVEGCGMDILHQSALNSGKKIMGFVMDALDPAGSEIVPDITSAGGRSALTGQQLWLVSSIVPFLLAPIFSSPDNLGRYVRTMVVTEVADRISVEPGTPAGKAAVCNAFQDLVKACSWSCFVVRSPSFTAEGLHVLQKSQQEQVKQATRVIGVALGTIHKGLHITRNVVVNGVVTNCNVGEAKNKELKASAPSASGRDNARHIWRATNDSLAIKALADGIEWTASGDLCRQTLREVFSVLPLAPALSDTPSAGRPWDRADWQSVVRGTLPTALQLEALYKVKLGCGREESGPLCNDDVCAFCWRGNSGLHNGSVTCFNHWGNAPEEASAGTGTLRGGPVKDAAEFGNKWMIQETSRANDVELYVDTSARRSGERRQAATTLGRIACFFEHQGNDSRHLVDGKVQEGGEWTIWVAVKEYVTVGMGQGRKVNYPTGCDVFYLRRSVQFFHASGIRSMVHMMHACATTGASSCCLLRGEGKKDEWRCTPTQSAHYLLN